MMKARIKSASTLLAVAHGFTYPQVFHDYFVTVHWPNGTACPRMVL
jgi:hypothetical protein